jgi:hypothetical protein
MDEIELRRRQALEWARKTGEKKAEAEKKAVAKPNPHVESVKIDFKCSRTGNKWAVFLEKENETSLFRIKSVGNESTTAQSGSGTSSTPKSVVIDMNNIENWGGTNCPHCGDGGWVKCACGKMACQGGVLWRDGQRFFRCPWCGYEGFLSTGTIQNISGEMEDKRKFESKDKPSQSKSVRPSLPRPNKALPP